MSPGGLQASDPSDRPTAAQPLAEETGWLLEQCTALSVADSGV
jgi:hypothetical protein